MESKQIAYIAPEVSVWGVTVEEGFAVSGNLSGFDDSGEEIPW